MRAIVASLLVLTAAPAVAQKAPDLPPEILSPTLMQGWQTQQPAARPEDQAKLALQWAKQPSDFFASIALRYASLTPTSFHLRK